jgi:hypothetical protein
MSVAQVDRTDRAFRPGDRLLVRRLLAAPVALAHLNNLLRHDHQTIRALTRRPFANLRWYWAEGSKEALASGWLFMPAR